MVRCVRAHRAGGCPYLGTEFEVVDEDDDGVCGFVNGRKLRFERVEVEFVPEVEVEEPSPSMYGRLVYEPAVLEMQRILRTGATEDLTASELNREAVAARVARGGRPEIHFFPLHTLNDMNAMGDVIAEKDATITRLKADLQHERGLVQRVRRYNKQAAADIQMWRDRALQAEGQLDAITGIIEGGKP